MHNGTGAKASAAIARLRGAKSKGLLVVKRGAALGVGNLAETRAALDSIHDNDDMDYQTARLRLYLIERDYSGASLRREGDRRGKEKAGFLAHPGSSCSINERHSVTNTLLLAFQRGPDIFRAHHAF